MVAKKNYSEILTEVSVDNFSFQVTWNPYEDDSCILWFRDRGTRISYTALGKFSGYDQRKVLDFVVRYSTSLNLRSEIETKKFSRKINSLPLNYFEQIELASYRDKERVYRDLFSLDKDIGKDDLAARRRMMIKKFHPDVGGDNRAMTIINDAYEYLAGLSC